MNLRDHHKLTTRVFVLDRVVNYLDVDRHYVDDKCHVLRIQTTEGGALRLAPVWICCKGKVTQLGEMTDDL